MASKALLMIDRGLLRAGDRVCVAVSGGADSVALLLALSEANTASPQNKLPLGVVLSAAHVHHGLRGADADADQQFVQELCARLAVPLTVFRVDTAARQAAEGEGVEEAARTLRYEALKGLIASGAVDCVATAHTLDDQAETVVMKMLRGAWTEGLGGISPELQLPGGGKILRPLLGVRRSEVEAFLRERGQGWRDDATNADLSLTRNKVRHTLMPLLREFNPGVEALLARTAEIAREEEAYWQAEVARVLPQVLLPGKPVRGGGRAVSTAVGEVGYAMEIERLRALPAALRRRIVRAAARKVFAEAGSAAEAVAGGGYVLSGEETAKVLALAGFGGMGSALTGKIGSRLELHAGLRVERSAREIRLWRQA